MKPHVEFSRFWIGALVNENVKKKKKSRTVYNSSSPPKPFFFVNASLGGFISFYYNKLQKVYLICQHVSRCPPGVHFSCAM